MIDKAQFEAHVRAEAERRWPMPDDEPDFASLDRQTAYVSTRMEHEWPLVEALQAIRGGPKGMLDGVRFGYTLEDDSNYLTMALRRLDTALSPYTTKPIER